MPARLPGLKAWTNYAKVSHDHHDSLEGLLSAPLSISQAYDVTTYGVAKRGQLVWVDAGDGLAKPFVAAEITGVAAGGDADTAVYDVEFYADFTVGAALKVYLSDGTSVDGTVAAIERLVVEEHVGLESGANRVTVDFGAAKPAGAQALVFPAAVGQTMVGVVYESTPDREIPMSIRVDGARKDIIAAGASAFVAAMAGVRERGGLLFISSI